MLNMADIRHASKEFLTEFIEIYRSHPALWKVKSKQYANRTLKNAGYDALVEFYRQVDPKADRDLVSKKIQSMRGSFRKELKKYEKYNKNGVGVDGQYIPSLWYFDLLMFTRKQDASTESVDLPFDMVYSPDPDNSSEMPDDNQDYKTSKIEEGPTILGYEEEEDDDSIQLFKKPIQGTKRRLTMNEPEQPTCTRIYTDPLKQCDAVESESVAFGNFVASKHAKLNQMQQMHAERLITSILHKAALNKLTDHSLVSKI